MSEQLSTVEGAPSDQMVRLYRRWGQGGAALLLSGHVMIDRRHQAEAGNAVVEDERHLAALSRWAEAASCDGAAAWLQLNHPGRQSPRTCDAAPVAPSAVPMRVGSGLFAPPRALSGDEVREIIARFATTAAVAKRSGFAGVQIHGAHGYLVSQFLSPHTNRRRDEWGGDARRRMRFLVEVVRAVRGAVGPGFPVGVKINSADFQRGGITEEDSLEVIEALGVEKIDLLEISGGTYEGAAMFRESARGTTLLREAFFLDFANKAAKIATMPLMLTGGFRSRAAMDQALASRAVDMIGMARPLAVEPALPAALLSGARGRARPVHLSTNHKLLDSMIIGSWHQQQLRRMGRGLAPKPTMSRATALAHYAIDALLNGRAGPRGFARRRR